MVLIPLNPQAMVQHSTKFSQFTWTDIRQADKAELQAFAEAQGLDAYQIRDSLEHGHLPKWEQNAQDQFLILRGFTANIHQGATTISALSNKIAFFIREDRLISIHRADFDFLHQVPEEMESAEDLLLHLMKAILETYEAPLKALDAKMEIFEQSIFLKDLKGISLEALYYLKTQTRITKKLLQMFQSVVLQVKVHTSRQTALQDILDRLVDLILSYEEVLENAQNLLNTYHSVSSQKNNDVMKLLTVFSAFFLPLTFIVGVYGMNFEHMPELRWTWGYYATLLGMALISLLIFIWFKRKKIL